MKSGAVFVGEQQILASVEKTTHALDRMRGLIGKDDLQISEGLWITPCNSVHMFAMRFPVDVVFLDVYGRILNVIESLKPWRIAWCWRAHVALELRAGSFADCNISHRDILEWREQ